MKHAMKGHNQGSQSKNVVRPGVIGGKGPVGRNPGAVSQTGTSVGNHSTEHGHGLPNAREPEFTAARANQTQGNEKSPMIRKMGDGRTVHAHGSQGMHGRPNPGAPVPRR